MRNENNVANATPLVSRSPIPGQTTRDKLSVEGNENRAKEKENCAKAEVRIEFLGVGEGEKCR